MTAVTVVAVLTGGGELGNDPSPETELDVEVLVLTRYGWERGDFRPAGESGPSRKDTLHFFSFPDFVAVFIVV